MSGHSLCLTPFSSDSLQGLVDEGAQRLEDAGVFFGHGTTNAVDESAWLVLWGMGLPLDTPLDTPWVDLGMAPITDAQKAYLANLFAERVRSRKPTAYITHEAWLQGIPFYVDERSIVPRSLIAELLADGSLDEWLSEKTQQVLDLCTGNGSLAVLAAMAYPEVRITGADISAEALEVAQINIDQHAMHERITLTLSDGLAAVPGPWDLILCNPPYVNAQSMAALPAEYLAEPELALAGGTDGMDFIRTLLRAASDCMTQNAVLVLEIGNEKPYFDEAFPTLPVFWLDTSAGDEQVLLITRQGLLAWLQTAEAA